MEDKKRKNAFNEVKFRPIEISKLIRFYAKPSDL